MVAECTRAGQPGTTYTWTAGSGLVIVSGQGTAAVVVASVVGSTGTTTVRVVATRAGYSASTSNQVWLHIGGYMQLAGPRQPSCYNSTLTYTLTSLLAKNGVTWHVYLDNVLHDEFIVSDEGATLVVRPTMVGELRVEANGEESCSSAQPLTANANVAIQNQIRQPNDTYLPCQALRLGPTARAAAYPNPADAVLHLAASERAAVPASRTAVLYNAQSREVRRTRAGEVQVNTAD